MEREKVINLLEDAKVRLEKAVDHGGEMSEISAFKCHNNVTIAIAFLKEQEWNLLSEDRDGIIHGLPGDDGKYIMTDGNEIWIDDYVDGVTDGIILDSGRDIREIKAWMYMPELPKTDRR